MGDLRWGIVGTGLIAEVIAGSIGKAQNATLAAVSSREQAKADAFVAQRPDTAAVEGIEALVTRDDVDVVYVATPTCAKEPIALAAIAAGKHVLVDKPYLDTASLQRMTDAAEQKGVVFMDATHLSHHPRTRTIQTATAEKLGATRSLHTAFYFPFADRDNIRYDPSQEPMGAVGDMAWYSVRAIVEFLQPVGELTSVMARSERDTETGAVIRASGFLAFNGGQTSTFDVGYTAGTMVQELQLLGTEGMFQLDDFVLDWTQSFAFQNPDIKTGYLHRTGMATRKDYRFVEAPSSKAADVWMIENFGRLVVEGSEAERREQVRVSIETQVLLDAVWSACE